MTTAVCCIAKLENHYIREWVEHYKMIGFDNVIIYDNNDKDGEIFNEVIDDYIQSGYAIINDYRGKLSATRNPSSTDTNLQIKAYRDAYKKYEDKFDWILFCDADEFLMFATDKSISEFLSRQNLQNANAIKFCWKYFDDNDLVTVENGDYSLVKRFTRHNASTFNNSQGKCILKTKQNIIINSAHCFGSRDNVNKQNVKCVNSEGRHESADTPFMTNKNHNIAWLNHYRYKTLQEYIELKRKRLYPDQSHDVAERALRIDNFFGANKRTQEKTNYINTHNGNKPPQKSTVNLNNERRQEIHTAATNLKTNEQFKQIVNSFNINYPMINRYKLHKILNKR